jgi:hypothetical protein
MLEKTEMDNEEWIIQRHRQHWENDTDNIGNMTQTTLGTWHRQQWEHDTEDKNNTEN